MRDVLPGLTPDETARAVEQAYAALRALSERLRKQSREVLEWCAREDRAAILVLARPYDIIDRKRSALPPGCPLLPTTAA